MRVSWHFGLGKELGLVFWALTLFEAAYGTWATIWPLWIEHLGASIGTVGILLSLGGLIRPFILLAGTWLTDRVDVRWLLVVSRGLLAGGIVFAAFVKSWEYLIITIICYSFGEIAFPVLQAHIPVHAKGDVGRAFSLTVTVGPSAALILTPLLSSVVISQFGIQGGLVLAAALNAIGVLFISKMDFARDREFARSRAPGSVVDVFRHVATRDTVFIHALSLGSLGLGSMLLPNFLQDERGISPATITLLSIGMAVGTLIFGFVGMRIPAAKRTPFLAAAWSIAVTGIGFLLFAVASWLPAIALAFLFRGGFFATWTFLLAAIGQYAPHRLQTRAFTVVEILSGGALSFAPLLAAWLYGHSATLPLFLGAFGAAIMACVVVWRYGKGFETNTPESPPITGATSAE